MAQLLAASALLLLQNSVAISADTSSVSATQVSNSTLVYMFIHI